MKNTHVTAGLDQQPTDLFPVTPTACGRVQGGLFVADVGQGDVVPGPEAHLDQPDTAGSCGQHQSVKMVGGFFKKCFQKKFKKSFQKKFQKEFQKEFQSQSRNVYVLSTGR